MLCKIKADNKENVAQKKIFYLELHPSIFFVSLTNYNFTFSLQLPKYFSHSKCAILLR